MKTPSFLAAGFPSLSAKFSFLLTIPLLLGPMAAAEAPSCISLDLSTTDLAGQGYVSDGTQPYGIDTAAQRIAIGDNSTTEHRFFWRGCPEIPTTELAVDIIVNIDPQSVFTAGEDTGVHAVLIEGTGGTGITDNEVRAACIQRNGVRLVALQLSSGAYSTGIPFDWGTERTFRVRRTSTGDGVIEANGASETVPHDRLASSTRPDPTFAFGCFLDPAAATCRFGPINPPCITPPPDMVSWWPGDGNAFDIQGGNNGTLQGGASFSPGKVGQAFSLDGNDGRVDVADNPALNPGTGSFTVDAWVFKTRLQNDLAVAPVVAKHVGDFLNGYLLVAGEGGTGVPTTDEIAAVAGDANGNRVDLQTGVNIPLNT